MSSDRLHICKICLLCFIMHKIDIILYTTKTILPSSLIFFSDTLDPIGSRSAKVMKVDESNAESVIESLQKRFERVLIATTMAIKGVPVNILRVRISWFLNHERQNSEAIEDHLIKLELLTTAEGVLNYLIRNEFIGYLNYELIRIFQEEANSEELNHVIADYEKCHIDFLQVNFNDIIHVFRKYPDLAPKYPVGLPKLKVHLESPWEGRSVFEWNEFLQKRFTWPLNLIISRISPKCIIITYAVLPFFVTSIIRDLKNPNILEELDREGVRVEFLFELENHDVASQTISMPVVSSVIYEIISPHIVSVK